MAEVAQYLKTWWGSEKRNPLIVTLKLLGFVVSFTASAVIFAFVRFEAGYDAWNTNADRIARAVETRDPANGSKSVSLPYPFGDAAAAGLPGVDRMARVQPLRVMLKRDQERFNELVFFAEPAFLQIFQVKIVAGDTAPLHGSAGLVISRRAAAKYFGGANPIGRRLSLGGDKDREVAITAVMEDWPRDSHIRPDFILPLEAFFRIVEGNKIDRSRITGWSDCHCYVTYLQFQSPEAMARAQNEVHDLLVSRQGARYAAANPVELQPLRRIYLHSEGYAAFLDHAAKGNPVQLAVLGSAALVLLLVSALNFINFSLAQTSLRSREFAMRRLLGAKSGHVLARVTSEAALSSLLVAVIAVSFAAVLLEPLSSFMDRPLAASYLFQSATVGVILLVVAGVGAGAGLVPATLVAQVEPNALLRGGGSVLKGSKAHLRLLLVALQFVISTVLACFAVAMYAQIRYVQDQPIGFDARHRLIVNGEGSDASFRELTARFADVPGVEAVAIANAVPTTPVTNRQRVVHGSGEDSDGRQIMVNDVDLGMLPALAVRVLAGRGFDRSFGADVYHGQWDASLALPDSARADPSGGPLPVVDVVVNDAASEELGFASAADAIGETVSFVSSASPRYRMQIVGVVADLRYGGPRNEVLPMLYRARDDWNLNLHAQRYLLVKLDENADEGAVARELGRIWNGVVPAFVGDIASLDDRVASQAADDRRELRLILMFVGAAILIAVLGSLGLCAFLLQRAAKGFAIRRVLGASRGELSLRTSMRLTATLALASLAGWPIAYVLISRRLEGFALRVPISLSWFAIATLGISSLALSTSFLFSLRFASRSPMHYLRSE